MRSFMVAYVRAVKKMARENGCWKEKKREWTQAHIRDTIGTIINEFIKKCIEKSNRCRENYGSTDYDDM